MSSSRPAVYLTVSGGEMERRRQSGLAAATARVEAFGLAAADSRPGAIARAAIEAYEQVVLDGAEEAHSPQLDVAEFHRRLGCTIGDYPAIREGQFRADLMLEEVAEAVEAITGRRVEWTLAEQTSEPDVIAATKEIIDVLVVTYGAAITFGVPNLAPFWAAVHLSNLAKEGGEVRADGKRLKPEGWVAPDLHSVFASVFPEHQTHPGGTDAN